MEQLPLIAEQFQTKRRGKPSPQDYEALARVRLSKGYIARELLFSSDSAAWGLSNFPEDTEMFIRAGKALCEKILEPVQEHWGKCAITFGYQSREGIEHGWSKAERDAHPRSSCPHQFDRGTWGEEVYARLDILPFCVEDGEVSKHDFGHWMMHNLDIDLLMQWTRSNVYCITISPKPRRVWLEWGRPKLGEPRQKMLMGTDYWQRVYPYLPESEKPKFGPSCTGGSMQWRR